MIVGLIGLVIATLAFFKAERLEKEIRTLRRLVAELERRPPETAPSQTPPTPAPVTPPRLPPAVPSSPAAVPVQPVTAPEHQRMASPQPPRAGDTLERRIGERLFLYLGMVVVVLGMAFFLRYAFEHDWISPAVRVALGLAGGIGFIAAGRALFARDYQQYGLFLTGGGIAILFLSFYAAYAFYGLIGPLSAFALLAATAVWTGQLADRHASMPLALMAVCGGFTTPFLVGGSGDAHVVLFSYDAALVAATLVLARRRDWPWLNLVSLPFVIATLTAWGDVHYDRSLYLRVELFMTVFCVLFVLAIADARRSAHRDARIAALFLLMAPLLYHAASVVVLGNNQASLLIYLVAASATVVAVSQLAQLPLLRLVGWVLVIVPLVIGAVDTPAFSLAETLASLAVWSIFVAPAILQVSRHASPSWPDATLIHASGIGAFWGIFAARSDVGTPTGLAWTAVALALANASIWWPLRTAREALHWVGVAATLLAIAAAIGLDGSWPIVAWSAQAASLVWLATRLGNGAMRIGGLALFAVAALVWGLDPDLQSAAPFTPLLNERTLTAAALIGFMYASGWFLRAASASRQRHERAGLFVAASAVTVIAMTLDIRDYWFGQFAQGQDAVLARELMLSAAWAVYGGVLVAIGMRYRYPPVRYFAIGLFGVTIAKVFAVDVQELDGIYRVVAFLAVGGVLLLASFLYQRSRRRGDDVREAAE